MGGTDTIARDKLWTWKICKNWKMLFPQGKKAEQELYEPIIKACENDLK